MADQYRAYNERICGGFEFIAKKARKVPEDSLEMTEQVVYMNEVRATHLPELKELIKKAQGQLTFLLECHEFTPEDVALNTTPVCCNS